MKPTLFSYPHISSFPVLMLLGFFFGWWLARRRARFYQIAPRHIDNLALILPLAGVFGARFFARLFYAKLPLVEALKVWEGDGLVFYGGLAFGAAAVTGYALIAKVRLAAILACLAPSAALGLAFGRVGCFLGGCCWGDVCAAPAVLSPLPDTTARQVQTFPAASPADWIAAVRFPMGSDPQRQHARLHLVEAESRSLPVHPVQLYEAVLAAGLCFWLHRRYRAPATAVSAAIALLIGYSIIRFATEYLRADNKVYAWGLTFSQVVSLLILITCGIFLLIRRQKGTPQITPLQDEPLRSILSQNR
jgi:phosphatidylglycerol:prolipoprotein diacylglycerol transferase